MPIATLQFNLPEEQADFWMAANGLALCGSLSAVAREIRNILKYGEPDAETRKALERVREEIDFDLLDRLEED